MRAHADILLASSPGAASWAEFLASFRRNAAEQMDMLPVAAFFVLLLVIAVMNWKLAKRLARPARGGAARGRPRRARDDDDEHRRAA